MNIEDAEYFDVACCMIDALKIERFDSDASAVEHSFARSIDSAVQIGWRLLYWHDIQYRLTFEQALLAFHCLARSHDPQLQMEGQKMLQDYMDKNDEQVDWFFSLPVSSLSLVLQRSLHAAATMRLPEDPPHHDSRHD